MLVCVVQLLVPGLASPSRVRSNRFHEGEQDKPRGARPCRPWADLLRRTSAIDVLSCPRCGGRMHLLAVVTKEESAARYLRARGELEEVPARTKSRGPPYWKSTVLRRGAANDGE